MKKRLKKYAMAMAIVFTTVSSCLPCHAEAITSYAIEYAILYIMGLCGYTVSNSDIYIGATSVTPSEKMVAITKPVIEYAAKTWDWWDDFSSNLTINDSRLNDFKKAFDGIIFQPINGTNITQKTSEFVGNPPQFYQGVSNFTYNKDYVNENYQNLEITHDLYNNYWVGNSIGRLAVLKTSVSSSQLGLLYVSKYKPVSSATWTGVTKDGVAVAFSSWHALSISNDYVSDGNANFITYNGKFNTWVSNYTLTELGLTLDPTIGIDDTNKVPQLDNVDLRIKNLLNPLTDVVLNLGDTIGMSLPQIFKEVSEGTKTWSDVNTLTNTRTGVLDTSTDKTYDVSYDSPTDATIDTTTDWDNTIDPPVDPPSTGDHKNIKLDEIFPFCIPFDLYYLVKQFDASPQAPVLNIPYFMPTGNGLNVEVQTYKVEFSKFESLKQVTDVFFIIAWIFFLLLITRGLMIKA